MAEPSTKTEKGSEWICCVKVDQPVLSSSKCKPEYEEDYPEWAREDEELCQSLRT